ncbi:uncharacterized protein BO95DRAFT_447601 [Aspergillus brunneoviolaceus CBS 621.78]|uniref:Uncharacterized protein n=1 Tax=Aspergillus brunneoviolaceus CBS 621.78 TaxID=1450534 RepID=A0ACD1FV31_9EURO|nr:hypothetical protein BO95DRAFT_447601 [Aspergillus brunneoviolaceus CBS 621.78]RAH40786.1 hypothetical protein BO95DRAFT_447601 [Aspergillus brunneoviolaceus CBS 621.78]
MVELPGGDSRIERSHEFDRLIVIEGSGIHFSRGSSGPSTTMPLLKLADECVWDVHYLIAL